MPPLPPAVVVSGAAAFAGTAALLTVGRSLLRHRAVRVRWAMAAAAGATVALTCDAAPTGIAGLDGAYRAAFAVALVLAAARASTAALLVATGAAVGIAWPDGAAGSAATAAFATAVALRLGRRRRAPVVRAAAGALAAFALLNGSWPERHGATAAISTAAAAVLVVAALRRSSRRTNRWVLRGALAAAGFVLVAGVLAVLVAWRAGEAVQQATTASSRMVGTARDGEAGGVRDALAEARSSFAAAKRWTQSPAAWPARAVPVVAQHMAALDEGATAGVDLARRLDATASSTDLQSLQIVDGAVDLSRVAAVGRALNDAHVALRDAAAAVHAADSDWLATPVARTLDRQLARLSTAADDASTAGTVVASLPGFLGGDGPRRYFLAVQTPVESRATGGLIGNFGEVTTEAGRIRVARFGRLRELNRGGDPAARTIPGPADYVARYSRFAPATTWQNVNMSPDFPTVAEVIGHLYPQSGGAPVDGVVSVDPTALAALLRLTGPVRVASWPEPLTPENVEQALYFEQYQRYADDERVDFLGEVALKVTERLTSMRVANVRRLVDVLAPAVRGGHLMVTSTDPAEQALLDRLGLSGRLPPVAGDSLAVVTQNASGNKIDWFLRRTVRYRAVVDEATGAVEADAEITLRNEAPATGLPKSIIGSVTTPPLPSGTSRLFVSVYSPLELVSSSMPLEQGVELGRRAYSAFVDVPPGGEVTLRLTLHGVAPPGPYRLEVVRQPAVAPDHVHVDVRTKAGRPLVAAEGPLEGDTTFSARRRQAAPR